MDVLSGEVIPTMMTEMNISKFSLADGAGVECKPRLWCFNFYRKERRSI